MRNLFKVLCPMHSTMYSFKKVKELFQPHVSRFGFKLDIITQGDLKNMANVEALWDSVNKIIFEIINFLSDYGH